MPLTAFINIRAIPKGTPWTLARDDDNSLKARFILPQQIGGILRTIAGAKIAAAIIKTISIDVIGHHSLAGIQNETMHKNIFPVDRRISVTTRVKPPCML